jgi:hypothetical protein
MIPVVAYVSDESAVVQHHANPHPEMHVATEEVDPIIFPRSLVSAGVIKKLHGTSTS